MSRCHTLPRALLLSAITASSVAAAIPAVAAAADAPVRTISLDSNGAILGGFTPIAVTSDGREVLASIPTSLGGRGVIRNVATNSTSAILSDGDLVIGASTDLQKILFVTTASFSPKDTNGVRDVYVWNRQTDAKTLVSRDATGTAIGADGDAGYAPGTTYVANATISGNGNVVEFQETHRPPADSNTYTDTADQWRINVSSGAPTKIADGFGVDVRALDDAGTVTVSTAGIYVGSKRFDFPFSPAAWGLHARFSPDGSAGVFWSDGGGIVTAYVVDLTSGAKRTLSLPTWVTPKFNIWAVTNGGTRVLMSTVLNRAAGDRNVFGWMEQNGSLAQYGGDVPITDGAAATAVSPNAAFAGVSTQLAQLGTTPLPGSAPPVAFTPKVSDYVSIGDSICIQNFWYVTYTRPNVHLGGAVGADLRTPVSAQVQVTKTSTKQVVNTFTLTPKSPNHDLLTGKNGGFSAAIRLKLSDGTEITGTEVVPTHPGPECPPIVL